jgi:TM2 domain-containing membrane protein YozV
MNPQPPPGPPPGGEDISQKKLVAGILAILLGSLAIHKFYLGYTTEAIIHLGVSIVTCGAAGSIIGIIEGIIYLTKTDADFANTYIYGKKAWF